MVLLVVVYIAFATLSSIFPHQIIRYFSHRYERFEILSSSYLNFYAAWSLSNVLQIVVNACNDRSNRVITHLRNFNFFFATIWNKNFSRLETLSNTMYFDLLFTSETLETYFV